MSLKKMMALLLDFMIGNLPVIWAFLSCPVWSSKLFIKCGSEELSEKACYLEKVKLVQGWDLVLPKSSLSSFHLYLMAFFVIPGSIPKRFENIHVIFCIYFTSFMGVGEWFGEGRLVT